MREIPWEFIHISPFYPTESAVDIYHLWSQFRAHPACENTLP